VVFYYILNAVFVFAYSDVCISSVSHKLINCGQFKYIFIYISTTVGCVVPLTDTSKINFDFGDLSVSKL